MAESSGFPPFSRKSPLELVKNRPHYTPMALREIARIGHPVLRKVAEEVADPMTPEIAALVADMIETMRASEGVGLAAPQILVSRRVLVFEVAAARASAESEADGALPVGLTTLINPVLEPLGEEMELGWEGCLSLPGMAGMVPRYVHLRYRGVTPEGETIVRDVRGFHARIVQHETDHLDGILYPMRMQDLSTFGYVDEMEKSLPEI